MENRLNNLSKEELIECIKKQEKMIEKLTNEVLPKNYDLEQRINKANEILRKILVVSDTEHIGKYRPVKNTTSQDVYKTIVMLNEILKTPYRTNYNLLGGKDNE